GWIGVKNANLFKITAFLLNQRQAMTSFTWIKGHEGVLGNEESDKLVKEGANKDALDLLDMQIPKEFNLQGAKLITINQATAYQGCNQPGVMVQHIAPL
ncbi:hypothetical protein BJV74DRAFT_779754, partial [Russula compacta]